jgi:hypothetical protein
MRIDIRNDKEEEITEIVFAEQSNMCYGTTIDIREGEISFMNSESNYKDEIKIEDIPNLILALQKVIKLKEAKKEFVTKYEYFNEADGVIKTKCQFGVNCSVGSSACLDCSSILSDNKIDREVCCTGNK